MTVEKLHHLLLDNLSTAVLLVDSKLRIGYLNQAAENLLEVSSQRLLGSSAEQLLNNAKGRMFALQNALTSGQPFTERRAKLQLASQHPITADISVTPLTLNEKKQLLVEIQPMDRLLRIDREEALISTHDTSRNLVRGLAHEIKNPLGGIRGAAQLLAQELGQTAGKNDLLEYTDIISLEVERLCNLVDRLLGPTARPQFSLVNIHEAAEHVAALVEAETQGKLAVIRDYDPSIPEILGNREQLIQALLNLVRNAMQALQAEGLIGNGGHITLRSRIQRHFTIGKVQHRVVCRLDVIDNGPGIPADIYERIFFPMISGRAEGRGLGLPIAQSAINLHQGLIECDSVNGRTQFSIYLPLTSETDLDPSGPESP